MILWLENPPNYAEYHNYGRRDVHSAQLQPRARKSGSARNEELTSGLPIYEEYYDKWNNSRI